MPLLRFDTGEDPQAMLRRMVAGSRVELFELTRPSLHDIFVRIARPEPGTEGVHA